MPASLVFDIGPEVDLVRVLRKLDVTSAVPAHRVERTLLDTFDGRLARRRVTAWAEGPPRTPRRLVIEADGEPPRAASVKPARPDRVMVSDLPPGPARDQLDGIVEERALLPLARVRSQLESMGVLNRDGKTVVRLTVETSALMGRTAVPLGRRLHVFSVRGYPREFEQVGSTLKTRGRLTSSPETLAAEVARAAGVPPEGVSASVDVALDPGMRADHATILICRRLADIVDVHLPGTVADLDTEFLHDLRVAVRRSRSVLKEMKGVLSSEDSDRSRADLRWVQEITGPTRDLDVLLEDWPTMTDPVPDAMAGDLDPLTRLLVGEREAAYQKMKRQLRSARYNRAWGAWRRLVDDGPGPDGFPGPNSGQPIGEMAGGRILSVYRTMIRMGTAITDDSPPEALHDLRKRGKELRYLLELFGGMWPGPRVKPLVTALKGLQDALGHFQDDEIQVAELRSLGPALAATPGGTDSLIALGFVLDGLTASQRQARQDFASRFAAFSAPETRETVKTFAPKARRR